MATEDSLIEIQEYKYSYIDPINKDIDLPYLKEEHFKYSDEGFSPYRIFELKDDKVRIENTSYSGIIQLDRVRLHFSTKVKTNLFYMLSFLKDEKAFLYDPNKIIEIKEGHNFFDILGRLFLNELEEIFKKGFYKKYVRKEENLSFLKGKFLIKKQLQNEIKKRTKFSCRYDDLTFDNIENQIVLRAATLLIPLISDYNEEIKGDLIHYSNLLKDEVSLVNVIPEDCERIQFGRLNDYYETIIQFSKAILQNYFIKSTRTGYSKGFNFIVNMNKVYEDFITALLINIVEEDEKFTDFIVETQERFHNLVRENKIITKPDLILKRKNTEERPFILDAKYKRQENNADYYQVIAYSLAIPTSRACFLIYPSDEEVEESVLTLDPKLLGNSDRAEIKLYAVKINLALDEEMGYKEYIGEIKGQLKRELLKSGYFGG
jgi:5-methylcytosine-specific restriction enzyme subunit McrC